MNKIGTWWEQRLCNFIGWDYNLLKECGEASHRQLKIYASSLTIILTIWFFIGFLMAQSYFGIETILGRIFLGLSMSFIIYMVERVIILHIGSGFLLFFRGILAFFMAILGSFILDQIIFRNDLQNALRDDLRIKVERERVDKINRINEDIKHIDDDIEKMSAEVDIKPYFKGKLKTISYGPPDSTGYRPPTIRGGLNCLQ